MLFILICFTSSLNAQRCAVLEFKAGAGISQNDVDGISAIFITYFHPAGYTMVERTQIDKVIEEQGFQRSKMTQAQMVRLGEILNVSKIVVGDINIVQGQYNVDVRVINVETGTISATEGATFASTSYRNSMQSVAQKLAGKIAISPGVAIPATSAPKQRTSVEVLYGYLKIFPKEIGTFSSEPTNVISQINAQAQYCYDNWRIPTNEELSLLRANNYLGGGDYMTQENMSGIVLLVTSGKDHATLQVEEQERKARLEAEGWVDLGLPSGTLWKNKNEDGEFYKYDEAKLKFGKSLPSLKQLVELINSCRWIWNGNSYEVVGPSGESIILPATGYRDVNGNIRQNTCGYYWSYTTVSDDKESAWDLYFSSDKVEKQNRSKYYYQFSVRLVHE